MKTTLDGVEQSCTEEISRLEKELAPVLGLAREKFYLACRTAEMQAGAPLERLRQLEKFLGSIELIYSVLRKQRRPLFIASFLVNNYNAAKNKKPSAKHFEVLGGEFKQATGEVEILANKISYPLLDGTTYAHLTGYFLTGNNQPGSMGQYRYLSSIFERFSIVYTEVMLALMDFLVPVAQGMEGAHPDNELSALPELGNNE